MKTRAAFTLVELSIVLVILGLLIGGVLTGQTLIRAAELRSVTTQQQRYVAAVQTFRDKYFALPGDMTNATAYWGTATCDLTTASTTAATCNGDGNGQITFIAGIANEAFQFWKHLANAGLIEGNYDGVTHGSSTYSATTANSPSGRISSTLWLPIYYAPQTSNVSLFNGTYDNSFSFGGITLNNQPITAILKPEEAYNIDMKMDDGMPAYGKLVIRAYPGNVTVCTNATDNTTLSATYLLSSTSPTCALIFRQAY